jgi:hypothetical protein
MMLRYRGCQQLTTIDRLTSEHDGVIRLTPTLAEQGAAGRMAQAATTCLRISELHGSRNVVDEAGLFPEFRIRVARSDRAVSTGRTNMCLPSVPTTPPSTRAGLNAHTPVRPRRVDICPREHDGTFPVPACAPDAEQREHIARTDVSSRLQRQDILKSTLDRPAPHPTSTQPTKRTPNP